MGTLQVGGTTLGVKNTSTNKVDLSNVGDVTLSAGTIGTGVTINAGTNVTGIGQLVGISTTSSTTLGQNGNDVTIDVTKNYVIWFYGWNNTSTFSHVEVWRAVGNGSSHTFTELSPMTGSMGIGAGSGGNGTVAAIVDSPFGYTKALVFEEGSNLDIS
tara:strand:- start:235 stop:708 length:474 start_codon:yes stop_codon:yes gene_type:complete